MRNVETALGMPFRDRATLRIALTHRSYLNEIREPRPSNERLEFLGDAVLGMITTDYLFQKFPDMSEGELTNLRSALVRTETLARFANTLDLGSNLFLSKGEELSRGRQRPSGLACAFEALLAAVYLDRGYETARNLALRFIEPALSEVVEQRSHRNAKSVLQELVQSRGQPAPSYHVIQTTGPEHSKRFTVEVRLGEEVLGAGSAMNKRAAEQVAAEDALVRLGIGYPSSTSSDKPDQAST